MRTKSIFGLLICIGLVFSLSFAQPAKAASAEDEALQVVTNFDKAFNTSNFELMSSLYWHSPKISIFGPPKSMAFLIQGWDAIGEMWKGNFKYPGGTFNITTHNLQVTMIGNDTAIITGYNILTVNPPAAKEQFSEQERQTFVVQNITGKWQIIHQHISVLPTE